VFPKVSITQIKKAAARVASKIHPVQIILFGSYVHGRPTADSDVDLLLVIGKNSKKDRRTSLLRASEALDPRPFPVDLIVRSKSEIKTRIQQGDFFLQDIFKHGQILYEH